MSSASDKERAVLDSHPGGVVTKLEPRRGRLKPVAICLDGAVVCELVGAVVEDAGLRTGQYLSGDSLRLLLEKDSVYRARDKGLRLLAVRDRGRRELAQKLTASGFPAGTVAEVVRWLAEHGLLDDARFASQYAAEKRRLGWSTRRIRSELLRKGLGREQVDQALASGIDTTEDVSEEGGTELETAIALVRRRFGREFGSDPQAATRRVVGFLARRGFDWEEIQKALRTLAEETRGAEEFAEESLDLGPLPE